MSDVVLEAKLAYLAQECTYENVNEFSKILYDLAVKCNHPESCTQTQEDQTKITYNPIRVNLLFSPIRFMPLNRVKLGKSTLHGQGVFAQQDIKAFDVITFYPADAVLCHSTINDDSVCIFSNEFRERFPTTAEQTEECLKCIDKVFDLSSTMSIQAHPRLHDGSDNNFIGHFINDGCAKDPFSISEREYKAQVIATTNCMMKATEQRLQVTVVALVDIRAGQELTTSYGYRYWQEQKIFRTSKMRRE